ncbi:MAG: hypothetical protein A3I11_05540 [Elusimicrobia bacterium RIFCSPLOWO2_02_FULL_39_32]|nr:MAG: hypothetical protein A3B80_00065 [Elusimicrobia bacterium RIFCSPHIGHO2_02_FULL_39_36]OGR91206.1 MAG: hypothetical protein A3I11_05540 [Elusimicrobia bacterium RIFCSPLOWO2_02_FULL_39_32]
MKDFLLKLFLILFLFSFPLYSEELQTLESAPAADKKSETSSIQKNSAPEETPALTSQNEPSKEAQTAPLVPAESATKENPPQIESSEKGKATEVPETRQGVEKTTLNPTKEEPESFLKFLQDLVSFYEQEIVSSNKFIERWSSRVRSTLEREVTLKTEIEKIDKEILEKKEADEKKNKKEIGRLEKQVKRLKKDLKSVQKTLDNEKDELLSELKDLGKESQNALKERFQSISEKVETFGKAEKED